MAYFIWFTKKNDLNKHDKGNEPIKKETESTTESDVKKDEKSSTSTDKVADTDSKTTSPEVKKESIFGLIWRILKWFVTFPDSSQGIINTAKKWEKDEREKERQEDLRKRREALEKKKEGKSR